MQINPDGVTKCTLGELQKHMSEQIAKEATWQQFKIQDQSVAVMPSGRCYWYEQCREFDSWTELLEALREDAIRVFKQNIQVYTPIVAEFDRGEREYSEYFTKERVEHFREILEKTSEWIDLAKKGAIFLWCEDCETSLTCFDLQFEHPPKCDKCNRELELKNDDEARVD
tara:strand:- start:407 stop:916 length:510 start_codon:yes stop_codon:yes gene_type:complete